eukprot:NODE_909_length_1241_cov_241.701342_g677_i0.p1 GENE.NODE_909_length_1241_cov_241.701342_g677_i0~~NODE_909_length_1241_cov_241.701342_g677_i0.p1  ORF type:complete len:311 (-),score=14.68 NODE_909_length_1241_cov_241.701342_g677_i0:195-1127(-)
MKMPSISPTYEAIQLPTQLRGYVRYLVARHPQDHLSYSIGVRYVYRTEGTEELLTFLAKNISRKHKKHVHAWLCESVVNGSSCPLHDKCPNMHVSPEGYGLRRVWRNKSSKLTNDQPTCATPPIPSQPRHPFVPTMHVVHLPHPPVYTPSSLPFCLDRQAITVRNPYSFEAIQRYYPAQSGTTHVTRADEAALTQSQIETHKVPPLPTGLLPQPPSYNPSAAPFCHTFRNPYSSEGFQHYCPSPTQSAEKAATQGGLLAAVPLPPLDLHKTPPPPKHVKLLSKTNWADCDSDEEMDFSVPIDIYTQGDDL